MALSHQATPLIALDAIVIDTETTHLDPTKARLVEVAAMRLRAGKLDDEPIYRSLIDPGEPIPAVSTRIHKIDAAAVAGAPRFAKAWPEFSNAFTDTVVIGHTLGFDLAVLRGECTRAGLPWSSPRTLDTRLLAEVAEPNLGGYSIDQLAAWLDIEITGRHSALGDANATAKIFIALLPKLRDGNIRTLAEAEQACRALTHVLEQQHRAGWEEPVNAPARRAEPAFERIDTYPFRHLVSDLMSAPVKSIDAGATLADALVRMASEEISALLVTADPKTVLTRNAGIVTERDVLRALSAHGASALTRRVSEFASRPLVAVPAGAFVYRALGRMARLKLRHLAVENELGEICGVVTARDLLRLRAQDATILGDAIEEAEGIPALAAAWARLPQAAAGMRAEGVGGRDIAAVISGELAALTRRAGVLAERRMRAGKHGGPPCGFALCVLGSVGRGESLLAMDQDNAIVFEQGEPDGETDRWFARFGAIVADILHEVGVPYCEGGVMAKNSEWRGSLATWQARVDHWISRSNPADLLSVDIFFDLVGVHGDAALANTLWRGAFDAARDNGSFAKLLAESAGEVAPGLTMFGGLRTHDGRIDLKKTGLFGVVTTARVLAIHHHVVARATPARLAGIAALGKGGERDLAALTQAQAVFLDLILDQQLADINAGLPATNKVAVKRLTREQRDALKHALASMSHLDSLTRDLLF